MTAVIRVAAVDDHPICISGLERILRRPKDFAFVAQGSNSDDALRIARELRPDVMLLDIKMPGDGIAAAERIVQENRSIKVIILTASDDDEQLSRALAAGASGFLLKGVQSEDLLDAIRAVHRGEEWLAPDVTTRVLVRRLRGELASADSNQRLTSLNPREREVLELVKKGQTNQEVADELKLATATVKNYMSRILDKLKVRNRAEAIVLALSDRK